MKKRIITRVLCLALVLAMALSVIVQAQEDSRIDYGEKLDLLVDLLKENHLDMPADADPIRNGLLKMFEDYPDMFLAFVNIMYQSYDRFSYYMDPQLYEESYPSHDTNGGLGVALEERDDGCYITTVGEGSAAEAGGLLPGDKIVAIDGKSVVEYSMTMIADLIAGDVGTQVSVTVLRDGKEVVCTITRQKMAVSNVSYKDMGNGVAYMKIAKFMGIDTFMDFTLRYEQLPEQGVKSVILDLRDNPGGDVSCLINIMDQIIPKKGMPYLQMRRSNPMRLKTYESAGFGWEFNKLVILVNENTASAAEIMAGALHDLGYADLVGVTTYGKGLGQQHFQLEDGSYAIISNQEIILPLTGNYDKVGIKPNYYVEMGTQPFKMPDLERLDLNRGVYRTMENNVLAVEQRLKLLGYFSGTPDKVADLHTFHAVNLFQKDRGISLTDGYCDTATVRAINTATKELASKPVPKDTQLEKALQLAKAGAAGNTKPTPIDPLDARFVSSNS